ncbi:NUDIX hydrolase [Parablautia intestinalis]|jgi:ADP-ribose pyrophosphatase|uniref:NUDIX hydrolase n=1 Tax=Parablautia intestinalis TaxID=2320100 RepID=A0A3A9AQT4_9FIRM|nr:NUDIX hydrolase [Parablautia intestinalis]MCI8615454.1 NUDIX hydrolase [Lachnospiraceae bacterium]RKI93738.1 NUDIX hydrolase [Parablautia intestinalis]
MEEFKRLERNLVAHGAILDYYQDTIQIPNGNVAKWDFIKHKGAAAIVPVDDEGRLIMVKQYRNALNRDTLEIPAGGLNSEDEPTLDAAVRELKEETGFTARNVELLLTLCTTVAYSNEKIDIYLATGLCAGKQHLDEDEYVQIGAYTVDELTERIYAGEIQDAKTIAAVLAYKDKYCKDR